MFLTHPVHAVYRYKRAVTYGSLDLNLIHVKINYIIVCSQIEAIAINMILITFPPASALILYTIQISRVHI